VKRLCGELSWEGGFGRVRIINFVPKQIFSETRRWKKKNNKIGSKADI
jgi:hypothetical protein